MRLETMQDSGKSLAERVADQLAGLIAENKFKKGERLPSEFQLAEAVNVGRGTIREAVKILVSRNIVEIRRGLGTFVSEKTGLTEDPLGLNFVEDKSRLALDLMEVRAMIEQDKASILGQLRKFTEQIRTQAKEKQRTREAVKDGR